GTVRGQRGLRRGLASSIGWLAAGLEFLEAGKASGHESDRIGIDLLPESPDSPSGRKGVEIQLSGQQEAEEADGAVAAGVGEAQQGQVVGDSVLLERPDGALSVAREPLDRVLRQVVVPRHPVVLDEGEQLVAVLQQTLAKCLRNFRTEGP